MLGAAEKLVNFLVQQIRVFWVTGTRSGKFSERRERWRSDTRGGAGDALDGSRVGCR
jgi:hypothetical protein